MSCRIRAVEHRKSAAGLGGAHSGLQDRILLNNTIENAHKVRKKSFDFLLCIEVQLTFSFPFTLLRHYQMDASMLKMLFLSPCNSSIMLQKLVMKPMRPALALISHRRQNKDNCFG